MKQPITRENTIMTQATKRYYRPMTREQLAEAILTELVKRWSEQQEESCPHCLRANQLPHTDWCLLGRWLCGGEITNDS